MLRVTAVGICGSDLHTYQDARIGDTLIESPLTLGHEFAGIVAEIGPGTILDGEFKPGDHIKATAEDGAIAFKKR